MADAGVSAGVFQIRVKVEKNPELGFSISGGVGGRGNPFRPDDNVKDIFSLFNLVKRLFGWRQKKEID